MELSLLILSWCLLATGSVFLIIGAIGVLRFPDFYTRCHAAGITDSAGAACILVGLILQQGIDIESFKLLATLALLWLTSSSSTHALAKSAYAQGLAANYKIPSGDENEEETH